MSLRVLFVLVLFQVKDINGLDAVCAPGVTKYASSLGLGFYYECKLGDDIPTLKECPNDGKWNPRKMTCEKECLDFDTDYPGLDMNLDATGSVTSDTTPSAYKCQDLCYKTEGCEFFTWSASNQRCYLKSNKTRGNFEDGATSGPKACASGYKEPVLLHTDRQYKYYKVPVQLGLWLTSATVMKTCAINGMKPQCLDTDWKDDNCVLSPGTSPYKEMVKILCNGDAPYVYNDDVARCKHLANVVFWYMKDWGQGSALGVDAASYHDVYGKYVMSTSGALRYTICVRPI